jgi:glyoxylase-like metal-dependent hydrolase (beta-lactamase superfamily II)
MLDIHHISTGRGNATFIALPDASTMLIDAGAVHSGLEVSAPPKPNATLRPAQWVARYVQRRLEQMQRTGLDYLLVSHLHPDHIGDVSDINPKATGGDYFLTGVSDIANMLSIDRFIDRDYPLYSYPQRWNTAWANNYFSFIKNRTLQGQRVEKVEVASIDQIKPVGPYKEFSHFSIRNVAANGEIWSGVKSESKNLFPPLQTLSLADYPTENQCSIAIKLVYGPFSYFTGGDLTSYTQDGALPWQDMLGAVAKVVGPVTVATADHHGMFDSLSAQVVRDLKPSTWIIPTWHLLHPDTLQLERLLSHRLYSEEREVYATSVMRENLLANQRLFSQLQSTEGHVVVRVSANGRSYYSVVTSNDDEEDMVKFIGSNKKLVA